MKKRVITVLLSGMIAMACTIGMNPVESQAQEKVHTENQIAVQDAEETDDSVITVSAKNGSDIARELDNALKEARDTATDSNPVTVKVVAGSYKLSSTLHIYSNTTLDLTEGVTFTYSRTSSNMIETGTNGTYKGHSDFNASSACKGYSGFQNISIIGGKWYGNSNCDSSLIRFFHAKNIKLENVTVSGGGCAHQVELAAIDGLKVNKCTFKDLARRKSSGNLKQEALQFDIPCDTSIYKSTYLDGTTMKNVEVTNCLFQNVPRGVGTHTLLNGAYHENIKITGNIFKNIQEEAIIALTYYNCEIKNNVIENCGGGVLIQYFKPLSSSVMSTIFDGKKVYKGQVRHNAKMVVENNRMTIKYTKYSDEVCGVKVYGRKVSTTEKDKKNKTIPKKDYYISGVKVRNNVITTAGHGVHMMDVQDSEATGNKITGKNYYAKDPRRKKYDGVFIDLGSKRITTNSNIIKNMARSGVFTQNYSTSMIITNNQISGCKQHGVQMFNKSTCGKLSRNVISNIKEHAVHITKSTANISGNTISGVPYGVFVSSDAKGKIYQNTYKSGVKKKVYVGGKTSGITSKAPKITKKSGSKTSMTVKWKKVSGAGGYEVQYSTDPKLVSGVKSVSLSAKKTSASMKKPAAGKTYYVKVLSYKKVKGMQMYSSAKAMKL